MHLPSNPREEFILPTYNLLAYHQPEILEMTLKFMRHYIAFLIEYRQAILE
jgi:hypothetical protein